MKPYGGDVKAVDEDPAASWLDQPKQCTDQGRLAAPSPPDDPNLVPSFNCAADSPKH